MEPTAISPNPLGQEMRYRFARLGQVLGFYGAILSGPRPERPFRQATPPWSGNPANGRGLIAGRYAFAGVTLNLPDGPWEISAGKGLGKGLDKSGPPASWCYELHSFEWLRDLAAARGEEAENTARLLIYDWLQSPIGRKPASDRLAWSAGVTGRRVRAWLYDWPMISTGADPTMVGLMLDSLGRQVRHLTQVAGSEGSGADRLVGLIGLVQACLMLPGFSAGLPKAVGRLEKELSLSIIADGCHQTRSPKIQFEVLRDLVGLRDLFREFQEQLPIGLVTAIDRMAPVLRFFRHGDGGLALFHDTREGDAAEIDTVLSRADARGRAPIRCPHGGFERLVSGKLNVIVDVGAPPSAPYDDHTHAAPLAFEVSYGAERLIVNCGAAHATEGDWALAQRSTAAHSTMGVEDTNAGEVKSDGRLGKRRASTMVERNEADNAVWLEMSHDGYVKTFGLTHLRRLYLSGEGNDLRGEDCLEGPEGHPFTLRFHLHPKVQVSLLSNHSAALLKTPSGTGWRLRASGAEMSLTDSVYLGGTQEVKRTQQLILTGVTGPEGASVKWALQRESKR